MEIWSGGQTGVDRAALNVALELGIPTGGWVPRGRLAEDGRIPDRYGGLRETESQEYGERTRRNVADTDATLVLRVGEATGGTLETLRIAQRLGRPLLDLDLGVIDADAAARRVVEWLGRIGPLRRLNVAGQRASQAAELYDLARVVLLLSLGPRPRP